MSETNERSVASDGSVQPVAWAVMLADGERIYDVYATEEEAKAIDEAVTGNHGFVPLYRKPTLTDAERDLLDTLRRSGYLLPHGVRIVDGLLERLGGER